MNPGFATYSKPRKLTLLEALDEVEAAAAPSAKHTADLLYSLGSALREGDDGGRRLSASMQQRLVRAVTKLAGLMLQSSSSNSSNQRIEQLGGKELSLSAWALGKVKLMQGSELSIRLGSALASRALTNTSMDGQGAKGWLNWANLLYGLAEAGLKCSSSQPVQEVFIMAITQQLPNLLSSKQPCMPQSVSITFHATVTASYSGSLEPLVSAVAGELSRVMEGAAAQDWSNLLWACAKQEDSGSGRLGQGMPVVLREGGAAMASLAHSNETKPQALSNVLWVFASFSWYNAGLVSELAAAMAKQATYSKPQEMSNTLWALSKLGWYDASVYSTLTSAFVQKSNDATPQDFSSVLLSCAEARHWDSSVEGLAEFVSKQSEQQWGKWNEQELSNSLYAWAVLTAAGPSAASASPSFKIMAQQLFSQVSKRGPSAFVDLGLRQLYVAHQVAVYGKLPGNGLSANVKLLEKAVAANEAYLNELQRMMKGGAINEVAAALQRAGYEAQVAQVVENEGLKKMVPLLVKGVAVHFTSVDDYFRSPPGLLSGSKHIHDVLAGCVCGSSIVVPEAEWAGLKSDPQQQQAYMAQRLQEAVKK